MPLVPMPLGTENLLARQFGYKSDADKVHQTIRHGESYWLDAGRANGHPFLVMATCGFDAEVVRAVHLRRRGHISRWSYVGPILRAIRRYRFPRIHVQTRDTAASQQDDGSSHTCCWAMAFNLPKYGGGLSIEPDAVGKRRATRCSSVSSRLVAEWDAIHRRDQNGHAPSISRCRPSVCDIDSIDLRSARSLPIGRRLCGSFAADDRDHSGTNSFAIARQVEMTRPACIDRF